MEFRIIIPARYKSTRLPGKVLLDIAGKSMLQRVYEQAKASGAQSVVVATDDEKVFKAAEGFGAEVIMTDVNHETGTERLAEAAAVLGYDDDEIVVNMQCDEPLVPPSVITQLAEDLAERENVKVNTLCQSFSSIEELFNPDNVKVVVNQRQYALYFSRAVIPWDRECFNDPQSAAVSPFHFHHIGLFAYRVGFLNSFIEWLPSPLEKLEYLEQLRMIWYGARIHVLMIKEKVEPGVDNKKDLERVRRYFSDKAKKK